MSEPTAQCGTHGWENGRPWRYDKKTGKRVWDSGIETTLIIPPDIQAFMSGAAQCLKNCRTTTLIYTDGTRETVKTKDIPKDVDWSSWFSIVDGIQSLRK